MRAYREHETLQQMAADMAADITFRTYKNGCSDDRTVPTTGAERVRLHEIAWAALYTANWDRNPRDKTSQENALCNMAEAMTLHWYPRGREINGYDTIYLKLRRAFRDWPEENPV